MKKTDGKIPLSVNGDDEFTSLSFIDWVIFYALMTLSGSIWGFAFYGVYKFFE